MIISPKIFRFSKQIAINHKRKFLFFSAKSVCSSLQKVYVSMLAYFIIENVKLRTYRKLKTYRKPKNL
jgi:hypothetical protein